MMLHLALTLILIYEGGLGTAQGLGKTNSKELQEKPGLSFGGGLAEKAGIIALLGGHHKKTSANVAGTTSKRPPYKGIGKKTTVKSFKYYWNSADKVSVTDLRTQMPQASGSTTEEPEEGDMGEDLGCDTPSKNSYSPCEETKHSKAFRSTPQGVDEDIALTKSDKGSRLREGETGKGEEKVAEVTAKGKPQFWNSIRQTHTQRSKKHKSAQKMVLRKSGFPPSTTVANDFSLFGSSSTLYPKKSIWRDKIALRAEKRDSPDYDGALINPKRRLEGPPVPWACMKGNSEKCASSDDVYIFNDEEYYDAGEETAPLTKRDAALMLKSSDEEKEWLPVNTYSLVVSSSQDPSLISLKSQDQVPQARVMDTASHYFAVPVQAPCRLGAPCCGSSPQESPSSQDQLNHMACLESSTLSPLSSLIHFAIQANPFEPSSSLDANPSVEDASEEATLEGLSASDQSEDAPQYSLKVNSSNTNPS